MFSSIKLLLLTEIVVTINTFHENFYKILNVQILVLVH